MLNRKLLKNIAKSSETKYYHKNISFFNDFAELATQELAEEKALHNVTLQKNIEHSNWFLNDTMNEAWYATIIVNNNAIPLPIFVDCMYGVNHCHWTEEETEKLIEIYDFFKDVFTVREVSG